MGVNKTTKFLKCIIVLSLLIWISVTPVSAALRKIDPHATIFIGEGNLEITNPLGGNYNDVYSCKKIGWWQNPYDVQAGNPPNKIIPIGSSRTSYLVSPDDFVGYTGDWYCLDNADHPQGLSFHVADPVLNIGIINLDSNPPYQDVSDHSVPAGSRLAFRVTTNMFPAADPDDRWDYTSGVPGYITIKLKNDQGVVLDHPGSTGPYTSLSTLEVNTVPWYWNGGNAPSTTTQYWATDLYPPGTYFVTAESTLNNMRENYLNNGLDYTGKTVSQTHSITIVSPQSINTPFEAVVNCTDRELANCSQNSNCPTVQHEMTIVSDMSTYWMSPYYGWMPVHQAYVYEGGWDPWNIPGSEWIWPYPFVDSFDKGGPFTLLRAFNVSCCAQNISATMRIAADNKYNLSFNGQYVGSDYNTVTPLTDYNLDVQPGVNVISIIGYNAHNLENINSNPAGVIYRLNVTYWEPIDCPPTINETPVVTTTVTTTTTETITTTVTTPTITPTTNVTPCGCCCCCGPCNGTSTPGGDAGSVARTTGVPFSIWLGVWTLLIGSVVGGVLYYIVKKT